MSKYQLRTACLDVLMRIGENGAFSHLMIDQTLKKMNWTVKDEALFTEIIYGTIQRKLTLNYYLNQFVKRNKKMDNWVKWLLYMSFYQMVYLDKVPDHAIVHEAVEIAKKRGHQGIVKLVNGVLRSAQRNGFPNFQTIDDPIEALAIETSHPTWLVERWIDCYGLDKARRICMANLTSKPISVRINPLKLTRALALETLTNDGYQVVESQFSPQGIVVEKGQILHHQLFKAGSLTIQDQSSMLVAEMMDLAEGQSVLDACSAPGGKATHIGEKLKNTGHVYAYDLHEKKAKLVKEKAELLGLINIRTKGIDGRQLINHHEQGAFDRILIDAPCSGLGVIRGKPDIKYTKSDQDVRHLAEIQFELLEKISPLLKKNGKLLYSTCTIDPTENEVVIAEFLASHQTFEVDPDFFNELPKFLSKTTGITEFGLQIFPDDFNSDGFFLTRLKRKGH
ncbi:16S rRNA (cytosine967-C5)-methyltransferase [Amphibacillus marinus]|uniref:16S rRNA (cytosine(967)-C(5))-methyltransferase n=1 Tax=Amphibacillus marinus TaxID=872970 RepID=A0A1H8HYK4_9BACI|nr:16S rRNA (cytosine(967)-C(5))-methyltransferase RsmB [Amphibacillus marinus]SEN61172.1 16S rRNA (cytosine967-C5)-methyltransferase [Amphibacillus marinus]